MFRASSRPSPGATTAVAASGLPSELGDSGAVGRGWPRQAINLRSCCILLVDSVESMMMHGLANPKKNPFFNQF
jgi:hypothetical protein